MNHKQLPVSGKITANKCLSDEHYLITVALSEPIVRPLPGQFFMLFLNQRKEIFLGRPFSIYRFEETPQGKMSVQILYRVVGKGTHVMSELRNGDRVSLFGPHGKAFEVPPEVRRIVLLSGGVGIAPISYLSSYYDQAWRESGIEVTGYLGARTANQLLDLNPSTSSHSVLHISTDDGSVGHHGTITDLFARDLASYPPGESMIYACGPTPMLKTLADLLKGYSIPCQVLLEQRMACGIGVCLGCVVELKAEEGHNPYARVCKDGPVFNLKDIAWK
jgi:dihydroorotate dehydrogenase electron transfer subunit